MNNTYALAARRADEIQRYNRLPLSHDEWEALVVRLVDNAEAEAKAKAERKTVNIGGLWIQPQVAQQSRLGFNIDLSEVDEWTDERVELLEMISELPTIVKEQK